MALRMLALFLMLSFSLCSGEIAGRVVRIADGDTITILVSGGTNPVAPESVGSRVPRDRTSPAANQHKIRLQGIDAPEKKQAFGNVSRKHLSSLVAGKNVTVKYTKRDKYGRILGTVFADGKDVNLEMLKAGLAWHYKRFDSTPAYAQAESAARAARLGLWQDKNPIPPETFRHDGRARSPSAPNTVPSSSTATSRVEYRAGNTLPVSARTPVPVCDQWPDTGYWLSTNSNKRHNRKCENYRKTRGYPCQKSEGSPCGKCGG